MDFKSHEDRDAYFRDNADYFTAVRKSGVGTYERNQAKTLEKAIKLAQSRVPVTGGKYLIYAVIGEQSAYVQTVG